MESAFASSRRLQPASHFHRLSAAIPLLVLALFVVWAPATASAACSGYLPGNCLFERGLGYMMCNAGRFCTDFGIASPSNTCASGDVCTRMCGAAGSYGGTCRTTRIPWQLTGCGAVSVLRREIILPGLGVINCDEQIDINGVTCSIVRGDC